jgi:hypothetical protein
MALIGGLKAGGRVADFETAEFESNGKVARFKNSNA